jgi:hypothetical protein
MPLALNRSATVAKVFKLAHRAEAATPFSGAPIRYIAASHAAPSVGAETGASASNRDDP